MTYTSIISSIAGLLGVSLAAATFFGAPINKLTDRVNAVEVRQSATDANVVDIKDRLKGIDNKLEILINRSIK